MNCIDGQTDTALKKRLLSLWLTSVWVLLCCICDLHPCPLHIGYLLGLWCVQKGKNLCRSGDKVIQTYIQSLWLKFPWNEDCKSMSFPAHLCIVWDQKQIVNMQCSLWGRSSLQLANGKWTQPCIVSLAPCSLPFLGAGLCCFCCIALRCLYVLILLSF